VTRGAYYWNQEGGWPRARAGGALEEEGDTDVADQTPLIPFLEASTNLWSISWRNENDPEKGVPHPQSIGTA